MRRDHGDQDHPRDDSGFSLAELIVAMSIFGIVLAMFGTTIIVFTSTTIRTVQSSDQGTESRDVFNLFDKQVRSASAINRPVLVGTNWYVEYRTDAVPPSTCTQWVLRTATDTLASRTWTTGGTTNATPTAWRTVATDVVNTTAQKPFTFTASTSPIPLEQLTVSLRFQQGTAPATVTTSTFGAANTSTLTATNPDTNNDGVSDTQVCQDIANARP